jgi:hypothetical protein
MSNYLSDCRSVYNVKAGEGFPSMQLACRNCQTPAQFYSQNYSFGGNCSNATNFQDGRGYISDGMNYYFLPNFVSGTHPSSISACSNGVSHLNGFPNSGSCSQNMNPVPCPSVEHFEPPSEYNNNENKNRLHLTIIAILLFILIVLLFFALILRLNKKI